MVVTPRLEMTWCGFAAASSGADSRLARFVTVVEYAAMVKDVASNSVDADAVKVPVVGCLL